MHHMVSLHRYWESLGAHFVLFRRDAPAFEPVAVLASGEDEDKVHAALDLRLAVESIKKQICNNFPRIHVDTSC
eukprot:5182343-Amphidinium_carterae.1